LLFSPGARWVNVVAEIGPRRWLFVVGRAQPASWAGLGRTMLMSTAARGRFMNKGEDLKFKRLIPLRSIKLTAVPELREPPAPELGEAASPGRLFPVWVKMRLASAVRRVDATQLDHTEYGVGCSVPARCTDAFGLAA